MPSTQSHGDHEYQPSHVTSLSFVAQLVTRARTTTYATAGGIAKHALLRSCDLVRLHSSRNAAACGHLLSIRLRGRRLHSLVNSLSKDFIPVSIGLLAHQGVFLEIGKNDIWSHGRSHTVRPFVDYVAVAVDDGCHSCPGWNADPWWFNLELLQLFARVCAGEVQPLLFDSFAFEERAVQAAFRLLQHGANSGKVVVGVRRRERLVEEQRAPSLESQLCSRSRYGQEHRTDLGTLICLNIDVERAVAVLELRDPQRFNTMSWALGAHSRQAWASLWQAWVHSWHVWASLWHAWVCWWHKHAGIITACVLLMLCLRAESVRVGNAGDDMSRAVKHLCKQVRALTLQGAGR